MRSWRPLSEMPIGDHRALAVEVKSEKGEIALGIWNGAVWMGAGDGLADRYAGQPLPFAPTLYRLPATTFTNLCDDVRQTQAALDLAAAKFELATTARDMASDEANFARRQLARFVERECRVD